MCLIFKFHLLTVAIPYTQEFVLGRPSTYSFIWNVNATSGHRWSKYFPVLVALDQLYTCSSLRCMLELYYYGSRNVTPGGLLLVIVGHCVAGMLRGATCLSVAVTSTTTTLTARTQTTTSAQTRLTILYVFPPFQMLPSAPC